MLYFYVVGHYLRYDSESYSIVMLCLALTMPRFRRKNQHRLLFVSYFFACFTVIAILNVAPPPPPPQAECVPRVKKGI
jgi:hypothetical protein